MNQILYNKLPDYFTKYKILCLQSYHKMYFCKHKIFGTQENKRNNSGSVFIKQDSLSCHCIKSSPFLQNIGMKAIGIVCLFLRLNGIRLKTNIGWSVDYIKNI